MSQRPPPPPPLIQSSYKPQDEPIEEHFLNRENKWNEVAVYFGVGTYVTDIKSIDQQLPHFMKSFYSHSISTLTPSLTGDVHAKAFIFDPSFRHNTPLLVQYENEQQKDSESDDNPKWETISYKLYRKGRLLLVVSNSWFEENSNFFLTMKQYIKDLLSKGGFVALGIFTQPYCRVEENNDAIEMYNKMISDPDIISNGKTKNFLYFHLADYATRTPDQNTRVWYLHGIPHDQDNAVLKEVARYKGEGINFGVGSYAVFPGRRYRLHPNNNDNDNNDLIDYSYIQRQVEEDEKRIGSSVILQWNESAIRNLPFSLYFTNPNSSGSSSSCDSGSSGSSGSGMLGRQ